MPVIFRTSLLLSFFFIFSVFFYSHAMAAETKGNQQLVDVLRYAYENNPTLRAARAELRAVQENLPQAQSGWKPFVDASGNISNVKIDGSNFGGEGTTSKEVEFGVNQPLYRGGRTVAATEGAEEKIMAQRALLAALEQDVMLGVATSYMDVIRDRALLDLSANNETVIGKDREATQDRFDVGELTLTDVAQAEARLARAQAERIRASGNLQTSLASYEQVSGQRAGELVNPVLHFEIPGNLDQAIADAEDHNPSVIAVRYLHNASEENIDEVFGELLPELALFGSWNRQFDPQPGLLKESTTQTVGISASIPLYQAGAVRSRVRQARHVANQRYLETLESRRDIRQQVITSWENLKAAEAEIRSRESQVKASHLAQEGVRAENTLGARTILDTLNAEQEYLDAQATLISAQRNRIVAEFELVATLGLLTPETLGLPDFSGQFEAHLDEISWKILGTDVDLDEDTP